MYTLEFHLTPANRELFTRAIDRVNAKIGGGFDATISPAFVTKRAHYHEIEAAHGHVELVLDGYSPLTVHKVTLTIDPDRYMVGGYGLVGRRTAAPDGSDFIEWYVSESDRCTVPDLPRTACQSCGRNVARSETYLIRNPAGEILQVGGSCKDTYIPSQAVSYLTAVSALLVKVTELELAPSDNAYGGHYETMYRVESVIAHSLVHLKSNPFVKSSDDYGQSNPDATWRRVKDLVVRASRGAEYTSTPWSQEITRCISDLRNSDRETDREITAYDWCNGKGLAFLPSAVRSWLQRQMEIAKPQIDPIMPPAGRVTLEGVVTSQKMVSGEYGDTYKMILDCGPYRVWGTVPGNLAVGLGDRVRLTATVQPKELGFGFYSRPSKAELVTA